MAKDKQQLSLFDNIQNKIERSTSTVGELRCAMWAPVTQITKTSITYKNFIENKNIRAIKTSWGEMEVRNRLLTQTHKDIFDSILTNNRETKIVSHGRVAIYFTPYEVLDQLGKSTTHYTWLKEKIDEIADVKIKYKNNEGDEYSFNIFNKVAYSEKRGLYGVIIDEDYLKYFLNSLTLDYSKYVKDIAMIDDALIKAIIKFFLTHDARDYPAKMGLMEILKTVGYPIDSDRQISSAKSSIYKHIKKLEEYTILYSKKTQLFKYFGKENIYFTKPLNI